MKSAIALLTLAIFVRASNGSPLPDYPMVFARGNASASYEPNVCNASFRIIIRHANADEALKLVEIRTAEAIEILSNNDIQNKDVVGFEISKHRIRNQNRERIEFIGYEMSRRINFTIHDLTKFESIVTRLLETPDVVDIETNFGRTDYKEIEASLLSDAVADAHAQAILMAEGAGQRIVRLRAISQHGFHNIAQEFALGGSGDEHDWTSRRSDHEPSFLFVPALVWFGNNVAVIYEIDAKE